MKKTELKPPRLARWLFIKMNRYQEMYSITRELDDAFQTTAEDRGYFAAVRWYWHQAISSLARYCQLSFYRSMVMLSNYLKIALRNIKRNKSFTAINVTGLVSGIVSVIFILVYVQFELSYDSYIENADRIVRVELERKYPDERIRFIGGQSTALTNTLEETLPEIEYATSLITHYVENTMVSAGEKSFLEEKVFIADEEFFNVFDIKLIKGVSGNVLLEPNSVVITESMAAKYFDGEEAMGKILNFRNNMFDGIDLVVRGISQDLPPNSHFHYDFLVSMNSTRFASNETIFSGWYSLIYLRLQDGTDNEVFGMKFRGLLEDLYAPFIQERYHMTMDEYYALGNSYNYRLRPIRDIHLRSNIEETIEPGGNIIYVYMYSVISIVILLIACINFINLSTARSVIRAKEVGIRKTFGAFRRDLMKQFLFESVILSLISLIIALTIVKILFPLFRSLTGAEVELNYFSDIYFLPTLLFIIICVGLLSGLYPAAFLSSFKPVSAFKGRIGRFTSKSTLRNGLVVIQFMISISLIAGTFIINDQIKFMLNKDLGFDRENVIVVENGRAIGQQLAAFKSELKNDPGILNVAGSLEYPGTAKHFISIRHSDDKGDRAVTVFNTGIEKEFLETVGMRIIRGRNFIESDSNSIIINRAFAEALNLEDPVGIELEQLRNVRIIGVVEDFNYTSLHDDIKPFLFSNWGRLRNYGYVIIRIGDENIPETLRRIENIWNKFTGDAEFSYAFLDQRIESQYTNEMKTMQVTGIFSFLAILIGTLGLFGLVAFSTEQRTREIGVRKVLGASISSLLGLLIKELIVLVGVAFTFAVPVTYFLMQDWLRNFVYRIDLRSEAFILSGIIVVLIAVFTVVFQSLKAATVNPVNSLRHE